MSVDERCRKTREKRRGESGKVVDQERSETMPELKWWTFTKDVSKIWKYSVM
jgi:hypothetical protein